MFEKLRHPRNFAVHEKSSSGETFLTETFNPAQTGGSLATR
jgi:hypothetical protein